MSVRKQSSKRPRMAVGEARASPLLVPAEITVWPSDLAEIAKTCGDQVDVEMLLSKSSHQLTTGDILPVAPCLPNPHRIYRETLLRYVAQDVKDHPLRPHEHLVELNDLVSLHAQVKFASPVVECPLSGQPVLALSAPLESAPKPVVDAAVLAIANVWLQQSYCGEMDPLVARLCAHYAQGLATLLHPDELATLPLIRNPPTRFLVPGLQWNANSFYVTDALAANDPSEDRAHVSFDKSSKCAIALVLDGHGNYACADQMLRWIPHLVSTRLSFVAERAPLTAELAGFALIGAMLEADARWIDSIVALSQKVKATLDRAQVLAGSQEASQDHLDKIAKIKQQLQKSVAIGQSGACATCAVIGPDWVALSALGDCQALWVENGQATWLTKAQTPADPDEFEKLITIVGGRDSIPVRPSMQEIANTALDEYGIRWFDQSALFRAFSSELPAQSFESYAESLEPIARITGVEVDLLAKMLPRAGGNLAVTRALGDAHLKDPWFAGIPQKDKVPYIHAIPEITIVKQQKPGSTPILMIASDGVWEILGKEDVQGLVREFEAEPNCARRIIQTCLERIALKLKITVDDISAVPAGKQKRQIHDDMTCIIIWLGHSPFMQGIERGRWLGSIRE